MKLIEIFWEDVPYVVLSVAAVDTWWRYRYDKFGWTTRSSQIYESRLLSIGSPLFHFGSLMVIMGHVMGLFIPESWTRAVGMSDHIYHLQALLLGVPAGFAALLGIGLLSYRWRRHGPVFLATSRNDKADVPGAGMRVGGGDVLHPCGRHTLRRVTRLPAKSVGLVPVDLDPRSARRSDGAAAFYYQIHVFIALALFALWPFTRLVHAFSAPIAYLFRPYIV